ncbi:MAG: hypothetical protein C0392_12770 [Syntrophus sp. (in: bacteria)]|nr:hypothetical protein [Syntrophus sp. (in: bacteria)]
MSLSLMLCLIFAACFALSCNKKEPEPPKAPQWRAEPSPPKPTEPPPKPPEPPKQDVPEVKDTPRPREAEKPIPEKHEKRILKKKKNPQKPETPVAPTATSALVSKKPVPSPLVNLDRLNREFKTYHLNVWASEWSNNGIILNGYVKNEREREDALSLSRRYNPNVTDMINVVTVYDNSAPTMK